METTVQNQPLLRAFVTGYTSKKINRDELKKLLKSKAEGIKEVDFPNNLLKWRGYAFIDFNSKENFRKFIKLKKIRIEEYSMNLIIRPHKTGKALRRHTKDVMRRRIKVLQIPELWEDSTLESIFSRFGRIENCYIKKKKQTKIQKSDHEKNFELREGIVIFVKRRAAYTCFTQRKLILDDGVCIEIFYEDENYQKLQIEKFTNLLENLRNGENEQGDVHTNLQRLELDRIFNLRREAEIGWRNQYTLLEILDFHNLRPNQKKYHEERHLRGFYRQIVEVDCYRINSPL